MPDSQDGSQSLPTLNQEEVLAAKAAALAAAKSELETATGFKKPLAPGQNPPQLRRTEWTCPAPLLTASGREPGLTTPAPPTGSTPAWSSFTAPADGSSAGQPAYAPPRPPFATPADRDAPTPAPEPLLAWIRKNVGSDHQSEPAFISALVGNLLRCINTKAGDNTEQEKELIITFKSVFQAFLGRDQAKQLCAIYALQVYFYKALPSTDKRILNPILNKGIFSYFYIFMFNVYGSIEYIVSVAS